MRYGHKWLSLIDDDELLDLAISDWRQQLAGLTHEQVEAGLDVLDSKWPPSAPDFRDLCKGKADMWEHNTAAYRIEDKSRLIGSVKASQETRDKYISEIAAIIGGAA